MVKNLKTTAIISIKQPPIWRLHLMRGLFFLNFISLAFDTWPMIFSPQEQLDTLTGVTYSFWASFALLNLFGIRFPIRLLPILLIQLFYKSAWIIGTYMPAYANGQLNEDLHHFLKVCIGGIALNLIVIPWDFVFKYYLKDFFSIKLKFKSRNTQMS